MNCEEYRAASLAGESSEALQHHVESCVSCRAAADRIAAGRVALRGEAVWEEPSPELADRVVRLVTGVPTARRGTRRGGLVPRIAAAAAVLTVVFGAGWALLLRAGGPDWEVTLPATQLAPGASASVRGWNEESGTRMVLTVNGLAPAPGGHVYELWLSSGPVYISAGTFTGSGDIELWSGVSRADYPRLWVTLEPVDGEAAPSGQTVLDTGT